MLFTAVDCSQELCPSHTSLVVSGRYTLSERDTDFLS